MILGNILWQKRCISQSFKIKKKAFPKPNKKLEAITNTIALGFFVSTVQVCFACVRQYKKSFWNFEIEKKQKHVGNFAKMAFRNLKPRQDTGFPSLRRTKGSPRQKVCTVATPHRQLMVWVYWEWEHVVLPVAQWQSQTHGCCLLLLKLVADKSCQTSNS